MRHSLLADRTKSRRLVVSFAVLTAILVYVFVVVVYAVSDRAVELFDCADRSGDAVEFSVTPQAVTAGSDRMAALIIVESWGPLESTSGTLREPVTVVISSTDGAPSFSVTPEEFPTPRSVQFITTGEVEHWPFDTHHAEFSVVAITSNNTDTRIVPTTVCGSAHVPGWTFTTTEVAESDRAVFDGQPLTVVGLTASRSMATMTFGIVIVLLLCVLPVLALTVAVLAYRGRRKVEATLTSWMAAMLFAVVPLRSFLPGSPPTGSWVDYLVILWVIAGLVAALIIYVAAWIRWAPTGGRSTP